MAMVEVVDEAEPSMYMSLSTKGLFKKRIGKSMSVSIRRRTVVSNMPTLRRLI